MRPLPLHVPGDWVIFGDEAYSGMSRVGSAPVLELRRSRLVGLRPGHPINPAPVSKPAGRGGANARCHSV
jgi:hypothetical protein